ncbi:MAG TPA: Ig-like domain-containing protein [Myxococcaceae bacterium]|nr:Ig-like domain-containing protein [Myxococcaceae bacterium]
MAQQSGSASSECLQSRLRDTASRRPARAGALFALLLLLGSCGSGVADGEPELTALVISPAAPTLMQGGTLELEARATFSDGAEASVTREAAWSSSAPDVVSVSEEGWVEAHLPGEAVIRAVYRGVTATTTVSVTERVLESLEVSAADGTVPGPVPVGVRVALRAIGTYSDGGTENLTADVQWSSEDETIVTVENAEGQEGVLQGRSRGSTAVVASVGSVSARVDIEVVGPVVNGLVIDQGDVINAPGGTRQFTAHTVLSDGTPQEGPADVTWSVGEGSGATINADGLATVTGPVGSQQEIRAELPGTGITASVQLYVRRYVYASTNRRGTPEEQAATQTRGIQSYLASDVNGALTEIPDGFVTLHESDLAYGGAMHPSGRFVYFVTSAPNGDALSYALGHHDSGRLEVFAVDPVSGRLSARQTVQLEAAGADVAIDPTGRYLVTIANRTEEGGEIILFRVDPDSGEVAMVAQRSNVGGQGAQDPLQQVNFHPTEPFVYVACNDAFSPASGIYVMRFGEDGLTPIPSANPFRAGSGANIYHFNSGVVVHPTGDWMYASVLSTVNGSVAHSSVDHGSGELTAQNIRLEQDLQFGRMAIDPAGEHLFVTSVELRHYRPSPFTGNPSWIGATTYPAPTSAFSRDVRVDPTGRFVYLTRAFRLTDPPIAGDLVTYAFGVDGALTEMARIPLSSYGVLTSP